MKKLLSTLMATTIVISSVSTVVACGSYKVFTELYLVTDAGKISDKGFNESGKIAGDYFAKKILEIGSSYDGIGYYQSKNTNDIQNGYNIAKNAGAKSLILPGFHHGGFNLEAAGKTISDGTSIFIDGNHYMTAFDKNGKVISETHKPVDNVIGLLYRADISGFWAGIAAIIQSIIIDNTYDSTKVIAQTKPTSEQKVEKIIRMSTFGGQSNFNAVETFMVGYLASIEVYNQIFNTELNIELKKQLISEINDKVLKNSDKKFEELSEGVWASRVSTQELKPKDSNDTDWYSGSFTQGQGQTISENLLPQSDIIMPVAGGQTFDVLGVRKAKNYKTKLVGVDTNQASAFESYGKNIFLTSAEKNIIDSTIVALAHTTAYANDTNVSAKVQNYYKDKNLNMTFDNSDLIQQENTPKGEEVYLRDEQGNIKDNKLKNWNKTTIWTGGEISSDGNNLISNHLKEIVKTSFNQEALIEASKDYFKTENKQSNRLLDYVDNYVEKIFANLNA